MPISEDHPAVEVAWQALPGLLSKDSFTTALNAALPHLRPEDVPGVMDQVEAEYGRAKQAIGTLKYLLRQAENGTLHPTVVIQNCRKALSGDDGATERGLADWFRQQGSK